MNERINELLQQARDYINEVSDPDGVYQGKEYPEAVREKFAELIVQECTGKILDSLEAANVNLTSRPDDDYWLGFRHACDDHLTDIKEHFGVK